MDKVNQIRTELRELAYVFLSGDGISEQQREQLLSHKEYIGGLIGYLEYMNRVIDGLLSINNTVD